MVLRGTKWSQSAQGPAERLLHASSLEQAHWAALARATSPDSFHSLYFSFTEDAFGIAEAQMRDALGLPAAPS